MTPDPPTFGSDVPCYRCGGRGTRHAFHLVDATDARGRYYRRRDACPHGCPICTGSGLTKPREAPIAPADLWRTAEHFDAIARGLETRSGRPT